nr:uncharacterized protein LOC123765507 isoform X1 [Procambarus clarkii]
MEGIKCITEQCADEKDISSEAVKSSGETEFATEVPAACSAESQITGKVADCSNKKTNPDELNRVENDAAEETGASEIKFNEVTHSFNLTEDNDCKQIVDVTKVDLEIKESLDGIINGKKSKIPETGGALTTETICVDARCGEVKSCLEVGEIVSNESSDLNESLMTSSCKTLKNDRAACNISVEVDVPEMEVSGINDKPLDIKHLDSHMTEPAKRQASPKLKESKEEKSEESVERDSRRNRKFSINEMTDIKRKESSKTSTSRSKSLETLNDTKISHDTGKVDEEHDLGKNLKIHKQERRRCTSHSSKETELESDNSSRKLLKKGREHSQKFSDSVRLIREQRYSRDSDRNNFDFQKHHRRIDGYASNFPSCSSYYDETDSYSRGHEAASERLYKRQRSHSGRSNIREDISHRHERRESFEWNESESNSSGRFEERDSDSSYKYYGKVLLKDDEKSYSYYRDHERENYLDRVISDQRKFANTCVSFSSDSLCQRTNRIQMNNTYLDSENWNIQDSERVELPQCSSEGRGIDYKRSYTPDYDSHEDGFAKYSSSKKRLRHSGHNHKLRKSSRQYDSEEASRSRHDASYSKSHSASSRSGHARKIEQGSDPTAIYNCSNKEIREQCKKVKDRAVRRALLSLHEAHYRECILYLRQPDAHPDYSKEYRIFSQLKVNDILDLGGDPCAFDYHFEWKRYWPYRMNELLKESWEIKKNKCLQILFQKNSQTSSESSTDLSSYTSSSSSSPPPSSDDDYDSANHITEDTSRKNFKKKISRYSKAKNTSVADNERKCEDLKPVQEFEEDIGDLTLELNLKRFRRSEDSRETTKEGNSSVTCGLENQTSCSKNLYGQSIQEPVSVQILGVLKLLNYMKERFGELERPLTTLYLKAVTLKENKLDLNQILEVRENVSLFRKLGNKLEQILADANLSSTQKVIFQEIYDRFSRMLLNVKSSSPCMGLDMSRIAELTIGQDVSKSLTLIKNALIDHGYPDVPKEKLVSIYLHAKNILEKGEYSGSKSEKLLLPENDTCGDFTLNKGKSSVTCIEPSQLYQSEHQQQSLVVPVSLQRFLPSLNPDSVKNSEAQTQKPMLLLTPPPSSSGKNTFPELSKDAAIGEKPPPIELGNEPSVKKDQPLELEQLSPTICLAIPTSRQLSAKPHNHAALKIASISDCTSNESDSKSSQSIIKDCLSSFSPPSKDKNPVSLEDYINVDFKCPDYLLPKEPDTKLSECHTDSGLSGELDKIANTENMPNKKPALLPKNPIRIQIPKKPIRIKIPQLSKQKSFSSSFSPINDDQELL